MAELLVVVQADVEDYLYVYAPSTIDILRVLGFIGYLKLMLYCYFHSFMNAIENK